MAPCTRLAGLLAAALALSIGAAAEPASQAPASPSAWGGVFNKDQVARGRTAYNSQCARCHGDTLGGGENSPALVDETSSRSGAARPSATSSNYVRITMPSDGPGTLSRQQCTDIAAYVLSANGFPTGDIDLATELAAQPDHDRPNQMNVNATRY